MSLPESVAEVPSGDVTSTVAVLGARTRTPAPPLTNVRGGVGLAGVLAAGLIVSLSAGHTESFLPQSIRPAPASLSGAFGGLGLNLHVGGAIAVLLLMLGAYALVVAESSKISARNAILAVVGLHVFVLLAPPLISTDVFSYQAYARMGARYGINPYTNVPYAIRFDSVFPYVGEKWSYIASAYGPAFTAFSYLLAPLGIVAGVLVYKSIATVASLALVAIVWRCARLRGTDPVRAALFVGLNPLLVLYGVGGGHNDLLMLLALVAGVWMLLLDHQRSGGALAMLAIGIKLTAGLVLPFALAAEGARRARGSRARLLFGIALGAVCLAGLSVAVFGSGTLHLLATVRESQSEGDWESIPGAIGTRLGLPGFGRVIGDVLAAGFVAISCRLLLAVWRGTLDWIAAAGWATLAMLVCASSLLPWYVAWLLPFAALGRDRRLVRATIGMTVVVQAIQLLGYIPHG